MDKLKIIESSFLVLDKKNSGMKDSRLNKSTPIYIMDFFDGYVDQFLLNVNIFEVDKKINCGILVNNNNSIRVFNEVDYKDVRGIAKFHPGRIIKNDNISFYNGRKLGLTDVYATLDGKNFKMISKERVSNEFNSLKRGDDKIKGLLSIATWIDFTSEYIDILEIKSENSVIRLPTHPDASKELLKLRDIPVGMKKRPALINWVNEHTRVCKNNETTVKKHLRGKTQVDWMNYKVTVYKNT